MSYNIELDYETADRITLANLYDTYENLHTELRMGGPVLMEDRLRYEEVLDAVEVLCSWFDIERVAEARIKEIEKNVMERIVIERYEMLLKTMGDYNE